ncbi:MAG: hypothetical protein II934_03165 [Prevotella sp.]|nr:hypothetical protein [Prevotella sp.]
MRYHFTTAKERMFDCYVEANSLEEAMKLAENADWEEDYDYDNILYKTWEIIDEEGESTDEGDILYKDKRLNSLM